MPTRSQVLDGQVLEVFLDGLAKMFATQLPKHWDSNTVRGYQVGVIEIARHHLAGFSRQQILEERFESIREPNVNEQMYHGVIKAIANIELNDGSEAGAFVPAVWDARAAFDASQFDSITSVRTVAFSKTFMAFGTGDWDTCATSGRQGAAAFGGHLFYQMSIIGSFRRGKPEEAKQAGYAARVGLHYSPWHARLVELTLGETTAAQMDAEATDDEQRLQVICFAGLRAFTNGDRIGAKRILESGEGFSSDGFEPLLMRKDLERC
jgi:hypothetical protein